MEISKKNKKNQTDNYEFKKTEKISKKIKKAIRQY